MSSQTLCHLLNPSCARRSRQLALHRNDSLSSRCGHSVRPHVFRGCRSHPVRQTSAPGAAIAPRRHRRSRPRPEGAAARGLPELLRSRQEGASGAAAGVIRADGRDLGPAQPGQADPRRERRAGAGAEGARTPDAAAGLTRRPRRRHDVPHRADAAGPRGRARPAAASLRGALKRAGPRGRGRGPAPPEQPRFLPRPAAVAGRRRRGPDAQAGGAAGGSEAEGVAGAAPAAEGGGKGSRAMA